MGGLTGINFRIQNNAISNNRTDHLQNEESNSPQNINENEDEKSAEMAVNETTTVQQSKGIIVAESPSINSYPSLPNNNNRNIINNNNNNQNEEDIVLSEQKSDKFVSKQVFNAFKQQQSNINNQILQKIKPMNEPKINDVEERINANEYEQILSKYKGKNPSNRNNLEYFCDALTYPRLAELFHPQMSEEQLQIIGDREHVILANKGKQKVIQLWPMMLTKCIIFVHSFTINKNYTVYIEDPQYEMRGIFVSKKPYIKCHEFDKLNGKYQNLEAMVKEYHRSNGKILYVVYRDTECGGNYLLKRGLVNILNKTSCEYVTFIFCKSKN